MEKYESVLTQDYPAGRFHAKAMCSFEFSVLLYRKDEVLVKE